MGIGIESRDFLNRCKSELGVNFSRTAMIGRQQTYFGVGAGPFAEEYFESLGATEITSFDANYYESAEHIHDFNLPIPDEFKSRYSVVFDGGTLEHIFDIAQAIQNCMEMVETNGHIICISPTNNYSGHGFYQLNSELFYRVFGSDNGFAVRRMWLARAATTEFREAPDDQCREGNHIAGEVLVFCAAQKIERIPLFTKSIQQSGYVKLWK